MTFIVNPNELSLFVAINQYFSTVVCNRISCLDIPVYNFSDMLGQSQCLLAIPVVLTINTSTCLVPAYQFGVNSPYHKASAIPIYLFYIGLCFSSHTSLPLRSTSERIPVLPSAKGG